MSSLASTPHPHSFRMLTVRGIYLRLAVALMLPLVPAVLRSGPTVVLLVLSALGGGLVAELLVALVSDDAAKSGGIANGRVLYFSLLTAALVPLETAPAVVAAAAAAAVLVGLWLPGGPGSYWMHPVLVGIALVPGLSTVSAADPLAIGSADITNQIEASRFFAVLESRFFAPLDMSVTPSAVASVTALAGTPPATVTAGLVVPLLISAMIVWGDDLVPVVLPVVYLTTFALMADALGGAPYSLVLAGNIPMIAVIGLADPGLRPRRLGSLVAFGVLAGILTAVIAVFEGAGIPAIAGLLLAGAFRPLLDYVADRVPGRHDR